MNHATTTDSPRSRRSSRVTPFTISMPPNNFGAGHRPSYASSRPASATFFRAALHEVHRALYGGGFGAFSDSTADGGAGDRGQIKDVIDRLYESDATFENPLTFVTGRSQISDQFSLMSLVPGKIWSEMGELCEVENYYGNRCLIMTHTLHFALIESLADNTSQMDAQGYASHATTPYSHTPAGGSPNSSHQLQLPNAQWPLQSVLNLLKPRNIVRNLTNRHLKIVTRLEFNEVGRITHHEDTWGVKEVIEGMIPILGQLYFFERKAVGAVAGVASRVLYGGRRTRDVEEVVLDLRELEMSDGSGAGGNGSVYGNGSESTNNRPRRSSSLYGNSRAPVLSRKSSQIYSSNGLGLQGVPDALYKDAKVTEPTTAAGTDSQAGAANPSTIPFPSTGTPTPGNAAGLPKNDPPPNQAPPSSSTSNGLSTDPDGQDHC